jgi:hypothetical protein
MLDDTGADSRGARIGGNPELEHERMIAELGAAIEGHLRGP